MNTNFVWVYFVTLFLSSFGILSCSSTDSLIGNVSVTGCYDTTRTGPSFGEDSDETPIDSKYEQVLILTRGEKDIYCEWRGFLKNCSATGVKVDCIKEGGEINIRYSEEYADDIRATCTCPVTLYFTIRDAAQESFVLSGRYHSYKVDFKGENIFTIVLGNSIL
jgi:hypothetical protein